MNIFGHSYNLFWICEGDRWQRGWPLTGCVYVFLWEQAAIRLVVVIACNIRIPNLWISVAVWHRYIKHEHAGKHITY